MENGEVKEAENAAAVEVDAPVPAQQISGEVHVKVDAETGALMVNAPPNCLVALAILKAGEAFLTMQLQDQMRGATARRPPAIVKAGAGDLRDLDRSRQS